MPVALAFFLWNVDCWMEDSLPVVPIPFAKAATAAFESHKFPALAALRLPKMTVEPSV